MAGLLSLFVVSFGRKILRPFAAVSTVIGALLVSVVPHSAFFPLDLAAAFLWGPVGMHYALRQGLSEN